MDTNNCHNKFKASIHLDCYKVIFLDLMADQIVSNNVRLLIELSIGDAALIVCYSNLVRMSSANLQELIHPGQISSIVELIACRELHNSFSVEFTYKFNILKVFYLHKRLSYVLNRLCKGLHVSSVISLSVVLDEGYIITIFRVYSYRNRELNGIYQKRNLSSSLSNSAFKQSALESVHNFSLNALLLNYLSIWIELTFHCLLHLGINALNVIYSCDLRLIASIRNNRKCSCKHTYAVHELRIYRTAITDGRIYTLFNSAYSLKALCESCLHKACSCYAVLAAESIDPGSFHSGEYSSILITVTRSTFWINYCLGALKKLVKIFATCTKGLGLNILFFKDCKVVSCNSFTCNLSAFISRNDVSSKDSCRQAIIDNVVDICKQPGLVPKSNYFCPIELVI